MHAFFSRVWKRLLAELHEFVSFSNFLFFYTKKRTLGAFYWFEGIKNRLVKLFLAKRGRYNRPFLHIVTMCVLIIGAVITPYLQDTYPLFASPQVNVLSANTNVPQQSINVGDNVFQ